MFNQFTKNKKVGNMPSLAQKLEKTKSCQERMKLVLKLKSIRYGSYGARFQGDSDVDDIVMLVT